MDSKQQLENFGGLDFQEWTVQVEYNLAIAVNKITQDEFIYESINSQSRYFYDSYKARAQYHIANTPQVILADCSRERTSFEALVERGPLSLANLLARIQCEGVYLSLLKSAVLVVKNLIKKYGYFRLTPKMIKATHSGRLLVWFHQLPSSNHRELPFASSYTPQDDRTVLTDIVSIFQEASNKRCLAPLKENLAKDMGISFERLLTLLDSGDILTKCQPYSNSNLSQQKSQRNTFNSPSFFKKKNLAAAGLKDKNSRQEQQAKNTPQNSFFLSSINKRSQKKLPPSILGKGSPKAISNTHFFSPQKSKYFQISDQDLKKSVNQISPLLKKSEKHVDSKVAGSPVDSKKSFSKVAEPEEISSARELRPRPIKNCSNSHSFLNSNEKVITHSQVYFSSTNTANKSEQVLPHFGIRSNQLWDLTKPLDSSVGQIHSTQQFPKPSIGSQLSPHYKSQKYLSFSPKEQSPKKNSFRDSGNSLATTNFLNSITSSGRTKRLDDDSIPSLSQSKSRVLSSFGSKKQASSRADNRFAVKASKIIEQYNEEWVPNSGQSGSKSEKQVGNINDDFDLERDLDSLLMSEKSPTRRSAELESEMRELESEFRSILGE